MPYNPANVRVPLQTRFPQFDVHRELGPTLSRFYSQENTQYLLGQLKGYGYGSTRPQEIKPFMDLAASLYNGDSGLIPLSNRYRPSDVENAVQAMNRRVLDELENRLRVSRFGMEQYYRDIQYHRFPEYPAQSGCKPRKRESLMFPNYYQGDS